MAIEDLKKEKEVGKEREATEKKNRKKKNKKQTEGRSVGMVSIQVDFKREQVWFI